MKFAALTAVLLMAHCPGPDGKVDPYLTAHTIINGAQSSLFLADSIFSQWLSTQTDPAKIKKAKEQYDKIRLAVANGLVVAHDAVDIAQAAQKPVDIAKIMEAADIAWKDLYKLLSELLVKPASQPTGPVKVEADYPLKNLPKSLIPSRK
jgi:hypothetical protein